MKRCVRHDGFTLLEVVMAMGLFAVGVMGLALMGSGLVTYNQQARHRADALQLARNRLESLDREAYGAIAESLEEALDVAGTPGAGIYKREVAVSEKGGPARKEVTVVVSWWSKGAHRVVLKTVFSP